MLGLLGAGTLASAMRPLRKHMPGKRGLRGVLTGLTPIVVLVAVVVGMVFLLKGPVQTEIRRWPEIQAQVDQALVQIGQWLGLDRPLTTDQVVRQVADWLGGYTGQIAQRTVDLATSLLVALALIFFGTIYLLVEPEGRLTAPIKRMLPPHRRPQLEGAINDLEPLLRWWFVGTLISMLIIGTGAAIGFLIVGLKFAIPLAVLAGLSEIIPTVGPTIAFAIAILAAATQSTGHVIGVTIVYAIMQTLESWVILPWIMVRAVRIPPIVTLVSIIVWGTIFGAGGVLLAIPLDLVVWTIVNHFIILPRKQAEEAEEPAGIG